MASSLDNLRYTLSLCSIFSVHFVASEYLKNCETFFGEVNPNRLMNNRPQDIQPGIAQTGYF